VSLLDQLRRRREAGRSTPRLPANDTHLPPHGHRAVIVGAGLAGLVAALELLDRGFEVVVLERSAVPGGRLISWRDPSFGPRPGGEVLERATHGVWWSYNNLREFLGRHHIPLRERWVNDPHSVLPVIGGDGRVRAYRIGQHLPSLTHAAVLYWSMRRAFHDEPQPMGLRSLLSLVSFDPERPEDVAHLDGLTMTEWAAGAGLPPSFVDHVTDPLLNMCNFQPSDTSSALAFHRYLGPHLATWRDLRAVQFFDGPPSESVVPQLVEAVRARGGELRLGVEVGRLQVEGGRVVGAEVKARAEGERACPACHGPLPDPGGACPHCGYTGGEVVDGPVGAEVVGGDVFLVTAAIPAARELLGPLDPDPFFHDLCQLPTATPLVVYLWFPVHERPSAWERAHGRQEVLFTSGFPVLGTVMNMSILRPGTGGERGELIEVDLPLGERWDALSDDELVARVVEDLAVVVPGLPAPVDHRVLRWRDFTTSEVGSEALRPTVRTPLANLLLAGDWVLPSQGCFYMERCVVTAREAVNRALDLAGVDGGRLEFLPSETPSLPLAVLRRMVPVQAAR